MAIHESDLIRRLRTEEATFTERKSASDTQDWVKTVVAFANSLRPDQNGVLYLGVTNKGEIQDHNTDLDSLQKKFVEKTKVIFPQCPYFEATVVSHEGKECLAITVPGGTQKPYFAGPPYFRVASTSAKATPAQFEQLLAARSDKAYELQQWVGKRITLKNLVRESGIAYHINEQTLEASLEACNQFYVTVSLGNMKRSCPLTRIDIAYDHEKDRLQIERQANERW
jgi:predicted HTH transcriptional regulator